PQGGWHVLAGGGTLGHRRAPPAVPTAPRLGKAHCRPKSFPFMTLGGVGSRFAKLRARPGRAAHAAEPRAARPEMPRPRGTPDQAVCLTDSARPDRKEYRAWQAILRPGSGTGDETKPHGKR